MAETRRRGTRPDFVPGWEFGTLPEDEVLARGADLFDRRMFWEAHEVWEEVWRRRAGRADRDFLKGVIQAAAGLWHATQGNTTGAVSVISRAVDYLAPWHPARDGFDVAGLAAALQAAIAECRAAAAEGRAPVVAQLGPVRPGAAEDADPAAGGAHQAGRPT